MTSRIGRDWIALVAGSPVSQSLSPAIHEAAFRADGRSGSFGAVECAPAEVQGLVEECRTRGLVGASVTMPLKEAVIASCDTVSDDASVLGAVNCLAFVSGSVIGHNTDGAGCAAALVRAGAAIAGEDSVVLGAGGTARAVALALARLGSRVTLVNRTASRADAAAATLSSVTGVSGSVVAGDIGALAEARVLVNATSVGMGTQESPVDVVHLHPDLVVLDAVYSPLDTRLLRDARAIRARAVDGVWMLVEQARLQQQLWFGTMPDAAVMRRAAEGRLAARQ